MNEAKKTLCPICSSSLLVGFNPSNYSKCTGCSIVFQNPVPSEGNLSKLYENYYHIVDPGKNLGYENYEENRSPAVFEKHYLPWIKKYAKDLSGRFLDFGCGTGNLIMAIKNAGYTSSEGCEFAPDAFKPLEKKHIACYECKGLRDNSRKYNYITLIDVVEHLREPKEDFRAISESLNQGGIIFIETINIDDFFVKYFHKENWIGIAPAHTFLFGITSLKNILLENGFVILELKTYKLSGSFFKWVVIRLLSLFLKKIRDKYKNPSFQFTFGDGVRIVAQKM